MDAIFKQLKSRPKPDEPQEQTKAIKKDKKAPEQDKKKKPAAQKGKDKSSLKSERGKVIQALKDKVKLQSKFDTTKGNIFYDSDKAGNQKRQKTDEGFNIYTTDELKLG